MTFGLVFFHSWRKKPQVNIFLILFPSCLPQTYRLAASEIAKFQDQLIKRLIDDMSSQMETLSPSTGAITVSSHQLTPGVVYDYDWNFARAFLYSLTVLTTIGEFPFVFFLLSTIKLWPDWFWRETFSRLLLECFFSRRENWYSREIPQKVTFASYPLTTTRHNEFSKLCNRFGFSFHLLQKTRQIRGSRRIIVAAKS